MTGDERRFERPLTPAHQPATGTKGPTARDVRTAAEAAVSATWLSGQVILDLYEVKEVHEGGGMGVVYRVYHRGWNRDVAVKSPRRSYFQTEQQKEDFVREAESWVNLGLHPHVVNCDYVRTLGGIPRIFAEYVDGGSLADHIRDRQLYAGGGEAALARILDAAIQFAWGLDYAHERSLVHRDVKPSNALIGADETLKVADFGLARARASPQPSDGRSALVTSGGRSAPYASPEQAARRRLDRSSDVWSWGVSLLELFIGEARWLTGQAAPFVLDDYLVGGVVNPVLSRMPPPLADLLRECFAADPARRPQRMADIATRLIAIYEHALGRSYPRRAPRPVELLADGLSNHALAKLDLGKSDEAEPLWEQALAIDRHHPYATYNRGVHRWRGARMTDSELVSELEAVRAGHPNDWLPEYLLGLVHLERADGETARHLMRRAQMAASRTVELAGALAAADSPAHTTPVTMLGGIADPVGTREHLLAHGQDTLDVLATSDDGNILVAGSHLGILRVWDVRTGRLKAEMGPEEIDGWDGNIIGGVALLDNGLVMAGGRRGVAVWDIAQRRRLRVCARRDGPSFEAWAFGDRGQVGVGVSFRRDLEVWDLANDRRLRTVDGAWMTTDVALSRDARLIVTAGDEIEDGISHPGTVRAWDTRSGRCLHVLRGHTEPVAALAVAGDATIALSGAKDGSVNCWDLRSGRLIREIAFFGREVETLAVSDDGARALVGLDDRTVRMCDLATGRCLRTLEGHAVAVVAVAFGAGGRLAFTASQDRTVRVSRLGASLEAPWSYATTAEASERIKRAADVGAKLERVRKLLDEEHYSAAGVALESVRRTAGYARHPEVFALTRQLARAGARGQLLSAWHVNTGEAVADRQIRPRWGIYVGDEKVKEARAFFHCMLALSENGRTAVSSRDDLTARTWDVVSGRRIALLTGHRVGVSCVAVTPDGRLAATASGSLIRVWDADTGGCVRTLGEECSDETIGDFDLDEELDTEALNERAEVVSVVLSADGARSLAGMNCGEAVLWDVLTGRNLVTLNHGEREWNHLSVALSPDARLGLTGGARDGVIRLWDIERGQCITTAHAHHGVVAVGFADDAAQAFSAGSEGKVCVWDLPTAECVRTVQLGGEASQRGAIAVSHDLRTALIAVARQQEHVWDRNGADELQIWDLVDARHVLTLTGHTDDISSVALSRDCYVALSASDDGTIRVWHLDWQVDLS
jgi:WD40 repeat protein/serine/threonine protein kinase